MTIPRGMAHISVPNNVPTESCDPQPAPNPPSSTIYLPTARQTIAQHRRASTTMPVEQAVQQLTVLQAAADFSGQRLPRCPARQEHPRRAGDLCRTLRHSGDDYSRRQGRLPRRTLAFAACVRLRQQYLGTAVDAADGHAVRRTAGARNQPARAVQQQLQSDADTGKQRAVHSGRSAISMLLAAPSR